MSSITGNDQTIPRGADPEAMASSSGSMGTRPSQAIFLGNLALGLLGISVLAPLVVLFAAVSYGG